MLGHHFLYKESPLRVVVAASCCMTLAGVRTLVHQVTASTCTVVTGCSLDMLPHIIAMQNIEEAVVVLRDANELLWFDWLLSSMSFSSMQKWHFLVPWRNSLGISYLSKKYEANIIDLCQRVPFMVQDLACSITSNKFTSMELQPYLNNVSLSDRELNVLFRLQDGHSLEDISLLLGCSIKMIQEHRMRAMKKLKLANAIELHRWAPVLLSKIYTHADFAVNYSSKLGRLI